MVINESHKLQLQRISIPLNAPIPAYSQIGTDDDDIDFDQESSSLFFDTVYSLSREIYETMGDSPITSFKGCG